MTGQLEILMMLRTCSGSLPKFNELISGPQSTCSPNFIKKPTHNIYGYPANRQMAETTVAPPEVAEVTIHNFTNLTHQGY